MEQVFNANGSVDTIEEISQEEAARSNRRVVTKNIARRVAVALEEHLVWLSDNKAPQRDSDMVYDTTLVLRYIEYLCRMTFDDRIFKDEVLINNTDRILDFWKSWNADSVHRISVLDVADVRLSADRMVDIIYPIYTNKVTLPSEKKAGFFRKMLGG